MKTRMFPLDEHTVTQRIVNAIEAIVIYEAKNPHGLRLDGSCRTLGSQDEVLTMQGNRSDGARNSRLSIISCTKTQKYIQKGCHVFLAQVKEKKTEDKLEEKQLEEVPIIWDFLEVFPEDLPGLPPT
ncbi:hypothetical protein Tco_0848696 [Tanacetum coccineum]